ncbi:hypothetical protein FTX61_00685 [Nitriliruptoraceae bacterium ZYF776]|nr:hypothetical protein [Profundirhabdus halotolerans]
MTPDADTLADPTFWLGTGSGAAFATLGEVDRHLVREVGEVRLLNGRTATIASGPNWDPRVPAWWRDTVDAEGFRRVATDPGLQRVARYSPWVITAAGQAIGDLAEPELTAGHRIARVAGTVVIDGTFGAVGGLLGGLGGSAVAPGPGTIAGGVAGGIAGGEIGAQVRERWAGGAIRWTGDRIDGLLDTVGGWFADPATTPAPASREALAPWDDLAFPSGVGGLDPVGGGGGR